MKVLLCSVLLNLLLLLNLSANEYKVSVLANFGEARAIKEWQPTIDYLNKKIPQHHFVLLPIEFKDLHKLKSMIEDKKVDYIITNPIIYVNLELSSGISKILTLVKKEGISQFGSVLITHKDSGIKTIEDFHGKIIAGIGKNGFGGWLIAYDEMLRNGFDPYKSAKEVLFLGTQQNILHAVLDRDVDVGTIRTGILEKAIQDGKITKKSISIIAEKKYPNFTQKTSSILYPEWAFAGTKNVSHMLSKQVASALLSLEANSYETQMAHYWEWTTPYSYRSVHELMKKLTVGEYKDFAKISIDRIITTYRYEGAVIALSLIIILLTLLLIIYTKNRSLSLETLKNANMAEHDSLTGLYNRNHLYSYQKKWIYRNAKDFSVMFIDLDNFKNINDNFGHSYGDNILKQVAARLSNLLTKNDMLVRQGGDEFIILKHQNDPKDIQSQAQKLISEISKPYFVDGLEFTIGCSAGISLYPKHSQTMDELLSLADIAMYKAKEYKNSCLLFDDEMNKDYLKDVLIEQELRSAVLKNELYMLYQPQINLKKELHGVEALVRWNNSNLGNVPVDKFITIAEETGLMIDIGDFIIKQSLRDISQLQQKVNTSFHLSINISVRQLIEENFSSKISTFVEESGMRKENITLEVTENIFIKDLDYIVPILEKLVDDGFSIALDDFGTGFSSLNILKRLPISELKIDKSFIDKVEQNKDALMLQSIIKIGKNLGMKIVAEGVESREQVIIINNFNCDLIQGYIYSKPITIVALETFVSTNNLNNL